MTSPKRSERFSSNGERERQSARSALINKLEEAFKASRAASNVPQVARVAPCSKLEGNVVVPPSKSYSHRALMAAGLSREPVVIENALLARDIIATADAWTSLGARITFDDGKFTVRGTSEIRPTPEIFVRESGTTLRFILPGLALSNATVKVKGNNSLATRPNRMIVRPLREQLGVDVKGEGEDELIPIRIRGEGRLRPALLTLPGDQSSQVISSFLFWLPLASPTSLLGAKYSTVKVVGSLVSKPYVDITIDVLEWAGIKIEEIESGALYRIPANQRFRPKTSTYRVPGDYSSAAFLLAAACLRPSNVLIMGLKKDKQGDRAILDVLRAMGARIDEEESGVRIKGPAPLRGIDVDCSSTPDLVPILSVLGAFAEGETHLRNISHLRYKETDRLAAPTEELRKLGVHISHTDDSISIRHSELRPGTVDSHGDHRMAMSLIVAGIGAGGVEVHGMDCIGKSYPSFVRDMESLGVVIS